MQLRVAGISKESVVDGPGIRLVIFTQGCPRKCEGCQNLDTLDPKGGYFVSLEDLLKQIKAARFIRGVTFSGGEPFMQAGFLAKLAEEVKKLGRDIVVYTGYTWEELLAGKSPEWHELLERADYLVDGPFILAERDISLAFRGSRNQRIIDVQKSLREGQIVPAPWGNTLV